MFWFGVFAGLSVLLMILSWRTLRRAWPRNALRLLAFEAVLGLIALAASVWFVDAFSGRQIASWLLLCGAAVLASAAVVLLHRWGAPAAGIEDTQQLVQRGVYRWLRHPLYLSLALLGLGAWLKRPMAWSGLILLVLGALVVLMARLEETENLERFGEAYRAYMRRSWHFLPWLY